MSIHLDYINKAIQNARHGMTSNAGGPFGAVIVKNGELIAEGHNLVSSTNDPTAHAEIVVIRKACQKLNTFKLADCVIYASSEPCPMCLSAIYWSGIKKVYYASTKEDAANFGFDDAFIYQELLLSPENRSVKMQNLEKEKAIEVFKEWRDKEDKILY